jgi:hypothetical protein
MFSVFYETDLASSIGLTNDELQHKLKVNMNKIGSLLTSVKTELGRMGFPSMHANLVIADLSEITNTNTGIVGGVGGIAYGDRRYMKIDYATFMLLNDEAKRVIVHEWAHLWMFGHSKEFNTAIKKLYEEIIKSVPSKMKHEEIFKRQIIRIKMLVDYSINALAKNVYIKSLIMGREVDEDDARTAISDTILNVIIKSLKSVNVNDEMIEKIREELSVYSDNLMDDFYDHMIDNMQDEPDVVAEILDSEIQNNNFGKIASAGMKVNVIDSILQKIKELYIKFNSKKYIRKGEMEKLMVGNAGTHFREYINKMINWYNAYGLSNPDELWATAVEGFFSLPMVHRKVIINLMNPIKTMSDKQKAFLRL